MALKEEVSTGTTLVQRLQQTWKHVGQEHDREHGDVYRFSSDSIIPNTACRP